MNTLQKHINDVLKERDRRIKERSLKASQMNRPSFLKIIVAEAKMRLEEESKGIQHDKHR